MKIIASSRLFRNYSLPEGIRLLQEFGYQGVEVWYEQLLTTDEKRVKKQLRSSDLSIYLHAASRDINLISVNPRMAKVALEEIYHSTDLAVKVNASTLVVHPGRMSSTKDDPSSYWENLIEVFEHISKYANKRSVNVVFENMEQRSKEIIVFPQDVRRMLDNFPHRILNFCLDIAHAATTGDINAFLEPDLVERVTHCHVSNSTQSQVHVPLWLGNSLITGKLAKILNHYDFPVVIEGFDPCIKPAKLLENNMNKLNELGF